MSVIGPPPVTALDRLIGWLSPHAGLSRHFARQRLARAYEAASPRDGWKPRRQGASANADHQADASALRGKARSLVQNVPYVRAGLDALVAYTIGTGIIPRATGATADEINATFAEWAKVCDADGRLDFWGIEAAAYRAMEQDGEVLIRLRPRRPQDNLPVPLQLQLLEIDWLDSSRMGTEAGNQVVNGIEYDAIGKVAAYWLWDQHPGDMTIKRGARIQSVRVPADRIIHLFAPERPGQGRGFTRLAPIIPRVRDLQLYEDAELARKNQETRLSVLYSGDPAELANPASDGAGGPSEARRTGELGELPSGGIFGMPAGGNFQIIEPKAAPGYVEYVKQQLHVIATGMGVTYEMMTGDVSEVNFSSARVRILQFRTAVEQCRWTVVIPRLIEPIWRAFINAGVDGGQIRRRDYAVDYSTPKWDYVNPEQDVRADLAEISGGLSSISEKLRQRGYKPADVFAELSRDVQQLRGLGLLDVLLFLQKGKAPGDGQPADGGNQRVLEAIERTELGRSQQATQHLSAQEVLQREMRQDLLAAVFQVKQQAEEEAAKVQRFLSEQAERHAAENEAAKARLAQAEEAVSALRSTVEEQDRAAAERLHSLAEGLQAQLVDALAPINEATRQALSAATRAAAPRQPMQVIHETDPATGLPTRSYLAPMPAPAD